jgi:predicted phosphodiesterase
MRMAIYSDIHGNTPGLKAVHARIDAMGGVDTEVCLGDLVYGGPGAREIIDQLRDRRVVLLRGNHEEDLAGFDGVLPTLRPAHRPAAMLWHRWLAANLSGDDVARLSSLPRTYRAALPCRKTILFCHSAPASTREALLGSDAAAENRARVFSGVEADILCAGHWHEQAFWIWHSLQIVCVGSVGLSPDGLSRWMLLESDEDSVRFLPQITPYDLQEFRELARASDMPRVLHPGAPSAPIPPSPSGAVENRSGT